MKANVIKVTPTLDTNELATGEQATLAFELANAVGDSGSVAVLEQLAIVDKGKAKKAFDIFFFNAQPTIASSLNGEFDVTDAEMADKCVGMMSVVANDFKDIKASSVAVLSPGIEMRAAPGKLSLWAVIVARDTVTYTSDGLVLRLTFNQGD